MAKRAIVALRERLFTRSYQSASSHERKLPILRSMAVRRRIPVIMVAAAALMAPLAVVTTGATTAVATSPAASAAPAAARAAVDTRVYVFRGRIGLAKKDAARAARAAKKARKARKAAGGVRATRATVASTYSTTRAVVAGTVKATASFNNRCKPVSMSLVQNSSRVASVRGSSPLVASASVVTGDLEVQLASTSCRTKFTVKVENTPSSTPDPSPGTGDGQMPQGDLAGWRSAFAEEFTQDAPLGTFLDTYTNFGAYPYPWTDTSRQVRSNPGYYHPEKTLSVAGGVLDAWLHYDSELGQYLVAAPTPNLPQMTYGRFAMRLRADTIPGYKIAPLLWPDSERWPDDGEINMPEGDLDGTPLSAFHHFARSAGGQDWFSSGVNPNAWHVYETLWSPGKVEFLVDGRSIGSSTSYVPNKPMHWVLQMETQIESSAPSTSAQGHVQIDWVKAYQYAG